MLTRHRRLLAKGELRLILLTMTDDRPRHGYDIIREVEDRTGGAYVPSPGVVYPTMASLLEAGFLEDRGAAGARKVVALTDLGRAHLDQHSKELQAILAKLSSIGAVRDRTTSPSIARAMENLKAALDNRLSVPGVDSAVILAAAALIDKAANKIETL